MQGMRSASALRVSVGHPIKFLPTFPTASAKKYSCCVISAMVEKGSQPESEVDTVISQPPSIPILSNQPSVQAVPTDNVQDKTGAKDMQGYIDLLVCALLLGTYNPTLKMIFAEEHPLDPATLTAVRTAIAAGIMLIAIAVKPRGSAMPVTSTSIPDGGSLSMEDRDTGIGSTDKLTSGSGATGAFADELVLVGSSSASVLSGVTPRSLQTNQTDQDPSKSFPASLADGLPLALLAAGLELGMYLFIEVSTESVGLQLTSATRAGFLTQSTAVLTPILAYLAGDKISPSLWVAVGLGLLGSCLVAYGGISAESADIASTYPDEFRGVCLLLTASLAISMATIRLGTLAALHCPVDLAAIRQITLGVVSVAWFLGTQHQGVDPSLSMVDQLKEMMAPISSQSISCWALVVYSALGPGAMATYLQTKGQVTVPATPAQLIHSTTPIWSALIAAQLALGGETMGPLSWAGGAAVLAASVLAARGSH